MKKPQFVGLTLIDDLEKTFCATPWQAKHLDLIPFTPIRPPNGYLFTLGSGCCSLATISIYGHKYVSGIDIFRQDYNNGAAVIDVDHYVAACIQDINTSYAIFKEPPTAWHHLTLADEINKYIKLEWQPYIKKVLEGRIVY